MEKARGLAADAIIFDLEDAVIPKEKGAARAHLKEALDQGGFGTRLKIVRINALDTEWGGDDARLAARSGADAILLPKVERPEQLDELMALTGDMPLWAMMETPAGMLAAPAIAAHPHMQAMVMGTNDLAKDLRVRFRADRLPLQTGLGLCLLAARAHGLAIIDGVYNAFRDEEGLAQECMQGRDMGFDGKTLIHPVQIAPANTAFSPSEDEIALARRQIEAFEEASAAGQGVGVVDGKIVENLHVETAKALIAKAEAIAALTAEYGGA